MSIKLFFCGDILINNDIKISEELTSVIKSCDAAICNLEGPLIGKDSNKGVKIGPYLNQNESAIKLLAKSGFNIFNLANNHILDYGFSGLQATISEIKRLKKEYIGAGFSNEEIYLPKIIQINDIKVLIISGCENGFGCSQHYDNTKGYAYLYSNFINEIIDEYKTCVDYIILNAHAGVEMLEIPSIELREYYQNLCDKGVDVIIGHHPHIPQGIESYNGSLIFYSLGNFIFEHKTIHKDINQSFGVRLLLEKATITYDIIYTKKINNTLNVVNEKEVSFSLEKLSSLLNIDYKNNYQRQSLNIYKNSLEGFLKYSLGYPEKMKLYFILKLIYNAFFNRIKYKKSKTLMLFHLFNIESNKSVIENALIHILKNEK